MIRKSTQLEIDDFLKRFIYGDIFFTYTKQAFSEARHKISASAFKYLNQEFVKKFYENGYLCPKPPKVSIRILKYYDCL
jgi:hypothetical protein